MTHSTAQTMRVWRTVAESASLLGISVRTLERRIASGRYPVELVNGRRLVDCQQEATDEAKQLATAMAMGEEARQSAGMLTVMLKQSLTERTQEVEIARAETKQARRMSLRAWQGVGVSVAVIVGLLLWLVSARENDRQLRDKVAELTKHLEQANATSDELEAKLEQARLAELTVTRWSLDWMLGTAQ